MKEYPIEREDVSEYFTLWLCFSIMFVVLIIFKLIVRTSDTLPVLIVSASFLSYSIYSISLYFRDPEKLYLLTLTNKKKRLYEENKRQKLKESK